jgi:hypothetical protein
MAIIRLNLEIIKLFCRADQLERKLIDSMRIKVLTAYRKRRLICVWIDKSEFARWLTFFPDYQVKRGEKTIYDVTIRHLLTMTAPYKGKSEPWKKSVYIR